MKLVNKMYYLVLALAVVFTLNNCSQEEITSQDVELNKSTNDVLAKKKGSSASGQAGLVFEQGEGGFNGYQSFSFHVSMDTDGNVSGSWQSNYNDSMNDAFDINTHGTIECATFVGNRVTMAGTVTKVNAGEAWDGIIEFGLTDKAYFEVVDNGEGKNADPDQFTDLFVGLNGLFCGDFAQPLLDINNGNIQVTNNTADARQGNGNSVIHHVSVGGNDAVGPGEDKSFSLVANMKADGSVSGQWVDGFGEGLGGIHVSIDCLEVDGNSAVLSGIITQVKEGTPDDYVLGERASTAVVDNGTSNNDPNDQISFSFPGEFCDFPATAFPLNDLERGQVKVMSKK